MLVKAFACVDKVGIVSGLNYQCEIYEDRVQAAMACEGEQQALPVVVLDADAGFKNIARSLSASLKAAYNIDVHPDKLEMWMEREHEEA